MGYVKRTDLVPYENFAIKVKNLTHWRFQLRPLIVRHVGKIRLVAKEEILEKPYVGVYEGKFFIAKANPFILCKIIEYPTMRSANSIHLSDYPELVKRRYTVKEIAEMFEYDPKQFPRSVAFHRILRGMEKMYRRGGKPFHKKK